MRSPTAERTFATSLRTRLTLWNTAVVLLMTAITLLAVRVVAKAVLYREADANLQGATDQIASALQELLPDIDAVVADARRMTASHAERGWFTHLLTSDGTTIWKSDYCPDSVATLPPTNPDRERAIVQVGPLRYARLALQTPAGPVYHVRVGMHTEVLDKSLNGLMRLLVPVGAVLSLLTPLAGAWLAARATRPVADILHTAERLQPTRLTDRLPVRGTDDELDRMSQTINRLLDEVAALVERQEQFVADAAHELRGPLAAVQGALEVAINREHTAQEYRETLDDILASTRHLSKVANDLLLLAERGGQQRLAAGPGGDAAAVARQATAMFAGVAEERELALTCSAPGTIPVTMDTEDLRRVLANLLDNAVRFTPAGGRIEVRVTADPAPTIVVADTGCGIEEADLARVFDRFYKADRSRTHAGTIRSGGLGLAICKSLVDGAGGRIGVESSRGRGTVVSVTLPPRTRSG
jgi:two-component system, OmpR family, heavy metal sensor histidine kinase CusS